jgi:hypothetical protein
MHQQKQTMCLMKFWFFNSCRVEAVRHLPGGRQMIAAVFCRIGEVMPLRGFFEVRGLHINTVVARLSISLDISWSCFAVGITTFFSGTVIA